MEEFLKYLANEKIEDWDVDHFGPASAQIFTKQEMQYLSEHGFCFFSTLPPAFLHMGLTETE